MNSAPRQVALGRRAHPRARRRAADVRDAQGRRRGLAHAGRDGRDVGAQREREQAHRERAEELLVDRLGAQRERGAERRGEHAPASNAGRSNCARAPSPPASGCTDDQRAEHERQEAQCFERDVDAALGARDQRRPQHAQHPQVRPEQQHAQALATLERGRVGSRAFDRVWSRCDLGYPACGDSVSSVRRPRFATTTAFAPRAARSPATAAASKDPLLGRTIGGSYVVLDLVGVGGMGRVYRAEQRMLGRTVAIKVIHPHLLSDEQSVARFYNEARAASRLNHPNSVSIIDFGRTDDGILYLAMEYLQGRDLARLMREEGPAAVRAHLRHRERRAGGARRSARARRDPSRPQARERDHRAPAHRLRSGQGRRLRSGQAARRRARRDVGDVAGPGVRHARLHVARARPRPAARRARRSVLGRRDAVRAADRAAAVHRRHADQRRAAPHSGPDPRSARGRARAAHSRRACATSSSARSPSSPSAATRARTRWPTSCGARGKSCSRPRARSRVQSCGTRSPSTKRFCGECGAALQPHPTPAARAAHVAAAAHDRGDQRAEPRWSRATASSSSWRELRHDALGRSVCGVRGRRGRHRQDAPARRGRRARGRATAT